MTAQWAILIGAALATIGWVYTSRRQRALSRKQHTINVILQANFNTNFFERRKAVSEHLLKQQFPQSVMNGQDPDLLDSFRLILNHYEFVAAGLRNGDFDEKLLRDTERSAFVNLFKECQEYIYKQRDGRKRRALYEHLEWVYERWETNRPSRFVRSIEWLWGRPLHPKRNSDYDA